LVDALYKSTFTYLLTYLLRAEDVDVHLYTFCFLVSLCIAESKCQTSYG